MTLNPQRSDELPLVAQDGRNGSHRPIDHAAVERAAGPFRATTFPNDNGYDELIVGALPGERIIGLSKLGRVVEYFSRDLQIQERPTTQVPGWIERELEPKGVGVVMEAEHLCMSLRGVQKLGAKTLRGLVRDDARTRHEFLALTTRTSHEQ